MKKERENEKNSEYVKLALNIKQETIEVGEIEMGRDSDSNVVSPLGLASVSSRSLSSLAHWGPSDHWAGSHRLKHERWLRLRNPPWDRDRCSERAFAFHASLRLRRDFHLTQHCPGTAQTCLYTVYPILEVFCSPGFRVESLDNCLGSQSGSSQTVVFLWVTLM